MNQTMKQSKRRNYGMEINALQKPKSVYRNLDDFLKKIPIAVPNQFGSFVIRGTRIA